MADRAAGIRGNSQFRAEIEFLTRVFRMHSYAYPYKAEHE